MMSRAIFVGVIALAFNSTAGAQNVIPGIVNADEFDPWPFPGDIVTSATFAPPPDLVIDGADLAYLLGEWGPNAGSAADIVTSATFQPPPDGVVDGADLAVLLGNWGPVNLTGTEYGRAWIPIPRTHPSLPPDELEPMDVHEVLLSGLGEYDAQGDYVGPNNGSIIGRNLISYLTTFTAEPIFSPNNDFRVDISEAWLGPDYDHIIGWSSQASIFHYINEFRSDYFTDAFVAELNLVPHIENYVLNTHFRTHDCTCGIFGCPGCSCGALPCEDPGEEGMCASFMARPTMIAWQGGGDGNSNGILINYCGNYIHFYYASQFFSNGTPWGSYLISHGWDREAVIAEYAGLLATWLPITDELWPSDIFFSDTNAWTTNITPAINDSISTWVGYRVTGNTETWHVTWYDFRAWDGAITDGLCANMHGHPAFAVPCDKGQSIRNVMMFDELNTSQNGVFPYQEAFGFGRTQSDLAAPYMAAIFYDIAHEVGLGVHNADLLFWKTISLIDDMEFYPMRKFGRHVQEAARQLWPAPGSDPVVSVYEDDIHDVLISRGIAVDAPLPGEPGAVAIGAADFKLSLPPSVGFFNPPQDGLPLESSHPNSQGNVSDYGSQSRGTAEFTTPGGPHEYVAYSMAKHSKLGPCDYIEFQLPDGSYNPDGSPLPDGTVVWRGDDRFGNITVLVPGSTVRMNSVRRRCPNDAMGFYGEDVRPFGWIVTEATPNGFAFEVERISEDAQRITYQLSIVDPSLKSTGLATYDWTFTEFDGTEVFVNGQIVQYAALRDQPMTISIERTRGMDVDSLTLREGGNDLDRDGGNAFVFDGAAPTSPAECGDPQGGDCLTVHAAPGCSDAACCELVCAADPLCCAVEWDSQCVFLANALCVACAPAPPKDVVAEAEACGGNTNWGCMQHPPVYETMACGQSIAGTVYATNPTRDSDFFQFTVAQPNTAVTLSFEGNFMGQIWWRTNCPTGGEGFSWQYMGAGCSFVIEDCLSTGTYRFGVRPVTTNGITCEAGNNNYVITLSCSTPCEGAVAAEQSTAGSDAIEDRAVTNPM